MKNFLYSLNYKKIMSVVLILFLVGFLTGCTRSDEPLNGFGDEGGNILGWLSWVIGWVMVKIGKFFGGSYGMAIIVTTLLVKSLAFPIYSGMNNLTFKMNLAQADTAVIQAKYAGKTDPQSKQRMSMEMQQVYKKHGIKFRSCLALPLQFLIFSAMYSAIDRVKIPGSTYHLTDLTLAGFDLTIGVFTKGIDLSDRIFAIILTLLVIVTQLLALKIGQKKPSYAKKIPNKTSPQAEAMQKQMKIMLLIMPLILAVMASRLAGLALYFLVGNIIQIVQTLINRKIQENKYKKMNPDKYVSNKDLKEAKQIKKEKEVIDI